MINNYSNFLFHGHLTCKNILVLLVLGLLFTLSFDHRLKAETYNQCFDMKEINSSTFCHQVERRLALKKAFNLLEDNFSKQNKYSLKKPTIESKTLSMSILVERSSTQPLKNPEIAGLKPRTISRKYEQAISVLDETGKKNLLHCFEKVQLSNTVEPVLNKSFYIKAMQKILNAQFEGTMSKSDGPKNRVDKHNCSKLIDLVIG